MPPIRFIPAILVLAALALSGCVTTAIVGGAAAGSAAFDERPVSQHFDDVALNARIRSRLVAEKDLPSRWISIEVINGKVMLTGYLPEQEQIDRAVYICRGIDGVKDVSSEIKLGKPGFGELATDTWITTRVKAKLLNDPMTSGFAIHVETVKGKVYLQGLVKNVEQRYRAQDLALSVNGVTGVENQLRIGRH